MTTYRERREARAERLRGWADKRENSAAAVHQSHERFRGDHAFNFQPGHIPLRAQVNRQAEAAWASEQKARSMSLAADEIERQAARSIYDDDPDAIEALQARLAQLEARREAIKAANAAYRAEHRAELRAMSAYERDNAMPHRGYVLQNLTGNITRTRHRLERLRHPRAQAARIITARYAGSCADCGAEITRGQAIRYSRAEGARCVQCPEEER